MRLQNDASVQGGAPAEGAVPALVEPAVPTLRLDPQLRAAVLAVPPPLRAPPPNAPRARSHAPLTGTYHSFIVYVTTAVAGV